MKDIYILAIESSCDETSVSVVKNGHDDLSTVVLSQIEIHKKYGGVVPEIASRAHIENITKCIDECLNKIGLAISDVDAIAVTYGPGLIGSLLIGVEAAKTLSFIYNKPLLPIHHIAGHIYATSIDGEMKFPLIGLIVSGGHTELILMEKHYSFKHLGGTLDDAVGEAYDKVARVLDIKYPGGPILDKLASENKGAYKLPTPLNDDSYNFSFSGIKSAVLNLVNKEKMKGNEIDKGGLAASFQDVVVDILTKKTMKALHHYNITNLLIAGGVSANSGIRKEFQKLCEAENINLMIPKLKYCTDNATMIGAAGYYAYLNGRVGPLNTTASSVDKLC